MNCRFLERPECPRAPFLTQSFTKVFGIALIMEYRNDHHFRLVLRNGKINGIRPLRHPNFSSQLTYASIFFRFVCHSPQKAPKSVGKPLAHSGLALVVPRDRFLKFYFRFRRKEEVENHFLSPNFFSSSAKTTSKGIQRSGCSLASFERRSNSAICSGVRSSSPYSSQILSINSRCSGLGRLRICSKMSDALINSVYQISHRRQARACLMRRKGRVLSVSPDCAHLRRTANSLGFVGSPGGKPSRCRRRREQSLTGPRALIKSAPRRIDQRLLTSSPTLPGFRANLYPA